MIQQSIKKEFNEPEYPAKYKQFLEYIVNANFPTIKQFDYDWEPIGNRVREDMLKDGYIMIQDGKVYLSLEFKTINYMKKIKYAL